MDKDFQQLEKDTFQVLEMLRQEFAGIRTNRPTTQLVENISVEYAGVSLPIKQLASIAIIPPLEIQITVWDKGAVGQVAKAIEVSKVGLTPNINGNTIHLKMPTLSDERRQELIRLVKIIAEKTRIRIRGSRDIANKQIDRAFSEKTISEDQKFSEKDKVQKHIEETNETIDTLIEQKIKEITS